MLAQNADATADQGVKCRNSTELSNYIWQLKDLNITPWEIFEKKKIPWEIAAVIRDCCKLRLTEKPFIIKSFDNNQLLNKKSELVNTCRHKSKLLLRVWKEIVAEMMLWTEFFSSKMI